MTAAADANATGWTLLADRCDLVDVALFGRHGASATASGPEEIAALQARLAAVLARSAEVERAVPEVAQCRALAAQAQVRPWLRRSEGAPAGAAGAGATVSLVTHASAQLDAIVAARPEVEALTRQLAYVEAAATGPAGGGGGSLLDTEVPPDLLPRLAALEATFAALAAHARAQSDAVDDVLETYETAMTALSDACGRWEGPLRAAEARAGGGGKQEGGALGAAGAAAGGGGGRVT